MSDIRYRVDADTKPFRSKMDGLKKTAKDVGEKIVSRFQAIGVAMAAIQGARTLRGLAQMADDLGDVAKAAGVSADFLQRWQTVNAGLAEGMGAKALEKFADQIGAAQRGEGAFLKTLESVGISLRDKEGKLKGVEGVLFEYTDAMANAKTEQQALSLASDAFGVKNKQLVTTLTQGSEALKEQMRDVTTLSNDEVRLLSDVNGKMEVMTSRVKVWGAKALAWYVNFARSSARVQREAFGFSAGTSALGGLGFDDPESLTKLQSIIARQAEAKQNALDDQAKSETEILETKKKQTEEQKKQSDKLRETLTKERDRLIALRDQLAAKRQQIATDEASFVANRFGMSVAEAANPEGNSYVQRFGLGPQGQRNMQTAKKIQDLEDLARYARMHAGDPRAAGIEMGAMEQADRLRASLGSLTDAERNPFAALEEQMSELNERTAEWQKQITEFGMKLRAN